MCLSPFSYSWHTRSHWFWVCRFKSIGFPMQMLDIWIWCYQTCSPIWSTKNILKIYHGLIQLKLCLGGSHIKFRVFYVTNAWFWINNVRLSHLNFKNAFPEKHGHFWWNLITPKEFYFCISGNEFYNWDLQV